MLTKKPPFDEANSDKTRRSPARRVCDAEAGRPIKVAALVDLVRHPGAGGHVKAWEHFADAARGFAGELDLTVYFLGDGITETILADNVRIRTVPPAFGTARIPWLRNGGGDTDLAAYNPYLARLLPEHDLFHATSAFAFAKTAETVAKAQGQPLISSLHTDAAKFARVYTGEIIERLVGHGLVGRWLIETIGVPAISARQLQRARDRILAASDHILVSDPRDEAELHEALPDTPISYLRRGIDKTMFSPAKRDRTWLHERYGVPPDLPVALFAGRVDESKKVMTVADAAATLLDDGVRLQVVIAGEGSEKAAIARQLGTSVTFTGNVMQADLARLMASADLFVFPSESEVFSNVVVEAKASGLPVIVTGGASTSQLVTSGVDGLVTPDGSIEAYAEAMRTLLTEDQQRQHMTRDARRGIETGWPDWSDVLAEDLLSVWRRYALRRSGSGTGLAASSACV